MVIVWPFPEIKTLHLVGKLLKTGDVKRQVNSILQGISLDSESKQLNSFRKSLKLIRVTKSFPPQAYINNKDC